MKPAVVSPSTPCHSGLSSSEYGNGGIQFFLVRRSALPAFNDGLQSVEGPNHGRHSCSSDEPGLRSYRLTDGSTTHITDLFLCPLQRDDGMGASSSPQQQQQQQQQQQCSPFAPSSQAIVVPRRRPTSVLPRDSHDGLSVGVSPVVRKGASRNNKNQLQQNNTHQDSVDLAPGSSGPDQKEDKKEKDAAVIIGRQSPCLKWALGGDRYISRDLLTFTLKWPSMEGTGETQKKHEVQLVDTSDIKRGEDRESSRDHHASVAGRVSDVKHVVLRDLLLTKVPQVAVQVKLPSSAAPSNTQIVHVYKRIVSSESACTRMTNSAIYPPHQNSWFSVQSVSSGSPISLSVGDCIQVKDVVLELGAAFIAPATRVVSQRGPQGVEEGVGGPWQMDSASPALKNPLPTVPVPVPPPLIPICHSNATPLHARPWLPTTSVLASCCVPCIVLTPPSQEPPASPSSSLSPSPPSAAAAAAVVWTTPRMKRLDTLAHCWRRYCHYRDWEACENTSVPLREEAPADPAAARGPAGRSSVSPTSTGHAPCEAVVETEISMRGEEGCEQDHGEAMMTIVEEEEEAAATPSPCFEHPHPSSSFLGSGNAGDGEVGRAGAGGRPGKRRREEDPVELDEPEVAVALLPQLEAEAQAEEARTRTHRKENDSPSQTETAETFSFEDHLDELLGAFHEASDRPPQLQRQRRGGLRQSPHQKMKTLCGSRRGGCDGGGGRAGKTPHMTTSGKRVVGSRSTSQLAPLPVAGARYDSHVSLEETQNTLGADYADYLQESVEIRYYD